MDLNELDAFISAYHLKTIADHLEDISSKSWFWDLTIPILIAGLVAYISATLTYRFNRKSNNELIAQQESNFNTSQLIIRENNKREVLNHTVLTANLCLNEIISIKQNYLDRIHPGMHLTQRVANVPTIAGFEVDSLQLAFVNKLSFLVPAENEESLYWQQPSSIHGLFSNYNKMRRYWWERNKLREELTEYIKDQKSYDKFIQFADDNPVPQILSERLIQSTEFLIRFTDDMGYQFHKFLIEFEDSYKNSLNKNLDTNLLDKVLKFPLNQNIVRLTFLTHNLPPNKESLMKIYKTPKDIQLFRQSIKTPYDL